MIQDVTVACTIQIEIGVVGQVYNGCLIGRGLITYLKTSVLGYGVGQCSGKCVSPVPRKPGTASCR